MNDIIFAGSHPVTINVSRHSHTSWEVIYCTSGSGVMHFDDSTIPYNTDDIVIIPPQVPHSNISEEGFTNVYIYLSQSTLDLSRPACVSSEENRLIRPIMQSAFMFYSTNREANAALLTSLGNVIVTYAAGYQSNTAKNKIVTAIEQHIVQNFTNTDFDLRAYLDTLPFSMDYLIKLFKKELGITPHRYLTDIRLRSAAEWLIGSTDSNVSEISRYCGFSEPLYFSRLFKKKYGVSPVSYRLGPASLMRQESDTVRTSGVSGQPSGPTVS